MLIRIIHTTILASLIIGTGFCLEYRLAEMDKKYQEQVYAIK